MIKSTVKMKLKANANIFKCSILIIRISAVCISFLNQQLAVKAMKKAINMSN